MARALSGTWVASGGVLSETSANTGRILRPLPEGTTTFAFTYRSPHAAENTTDYDPERYGLAVVRLFTTDWKYAALVLEPTGVHLREWNNDALVGELASAPIAAKANKWYDVKVAYSGTGNRTLTVSWAERGSALQELFTATLSADLAEGTGQKLGFGVGQLGDYQFRNAQFRDGSSTADSVSVSYQYDALGRRIAKTVDPGGTPVTTLYYYDGDRVIEERDGTGAVTATYVHGVYVDELLQMQRPGTDYYFHTDDLYNTVAVTDGSGAVVERYDYADYGLPQFYDASGTPRSSTAIANDHLFTGRTWDPEIGLYNYRTRYLDPIAGRFGSRDGIGLWGDGANLGNGQAYVGNNPWSCADPYGLETYPEGFWGWTGYYARESLAGAAWPFVAAGRGIAWTANIAVDCTIDALNVCNPFQYVGAISPLDVNLYTPENAVGLSAQKGKGTYDLAAGRVSEVAYEVVAGTGDAAKNATVDYGTGKALGLAVGALGRGAKDAAKIASKLDDVAQGVAQLKRFPTSQKAFRKGLEEVAGAPPSPLHEAHHVFPVELRDDLWKMYGIDVNDPRLGAWWARPEHQIDARAYTQAMQRQIGRPGMTRERMLWFGRDLAQEFGLKTHF